MNPRLGLSFVLVAGVGLGAWFFTRPDPHGNALRVRALATRGLADHLAQKFSGQKVLVLSNPFRQAHGSSDIAAVEEAGLQGLRQGFESRMPIAGVALPALRPEAQVDPRPLLADTETTTPLSYLVTPDAFDQAYQQHGDSGVVVSLIGLPAELNQCRIWSTNGPPRFGLLWPDLRVLGNTAAVQQALKSGKLAVFVLRKPGAPADSVGLGKDWRSEFDRRFVLVTSENAELLLKNYPGLF